MCHNAKEYPAFTRGREFFTAFLKPQAYPDPKICQRLARHNLLGGRRAMQSQPAFDQRQHPRRDPSLVASYRPKGPTAGFDATYTQNVRQGDMLLANAMVHAPGAQQGTRSR